MPPRKKPKVQSDSDNPASIIDNATAKASAGGRGRGRPRGATKKVSAKQSVKEIATQSVKDSAKEIDKELERIDQLFSAYANSLSSVIEPDGIEKMCSDLEVDVNDVRVLMLAWKLKAGKQGYFTLEEWRQGLKALRADTIVKLKNALLDIQQEVNSLPNFGDFYSFSFRYCLTEERQKSLDIETICELLNLVLLPYFPVHVGHLVPYLQTQTDYKVINMDQWMGFFRFSTEVTFPDFAGYDPDHAWPLIIDNFVEWMNAKKKS